MKFKGQTLAGGQCNITKLRDQVLDALIRHLESRFNNADVLKATSVVRLKDWPSLAADPDGMLVMTSGHYSLG